MKVYVYIRACNIYICLDIYEYLYLTGVCVACVTGATCCCVLSKVVEIYISTCLYLYIDICIYIYIYGLEKKIYKSIFIGCEGCGKDCCPVSWRPSLESH